MIYSIDVETQGLDARKFLLACVIDQNLKEHYFYSPKEVRKWIYTISEQYKKYKKKIYIYGHNHQYDLYSYFRNHLMDDNLKVLRWFPLFAIYNENVYLLDTMAFYNMPLSKVGDIVNLPKLETPEELIEGRTVEVETLKPYLFRDTLITIKSILLIKEKLNMLGFRPRKYFSAGQVAISSFFSYLSKQDKSHLLLRGGKIYPPKNPNKVREAFRGGRVQAFKLGKFDYCYAYDQNAQHPYVESMMDFPDLLTEKYINNPSNLPNKIGVSRVTIVSPSKAELPTPYLPISWGEYEQIYPNDCEMTATWTNLELNYALELGYRIKHIYWSITYEIMSENPFKNYQEMLFKLKTDSNESMKIVIKLLMNSFGMKFSQRNKNKKYKFIERRHYLAVDDSYKLEGYTDTKYVFSKESDYMFPYYYNPIISVLVTANARHQQYLCMSKIKPENLLYCDTDSIFTIGNHDSILDVGTNMGQWKCFERNVPLKIISEKSYRINDKVKMSGIPTKYRQNIDFEQGEIIKFPKLFTFTNAIKTGQMNRIGSSYETSYHIEQSQKLTQDYPYHIEEVRT